MEDDQELKFVCKLCYKKYSCGKSLGGHMRSHVIGNSAESDEKFDPNMRKLEMSDPKMGELVNGQSSYGLRENPRRTWRAADSTFPLPQERVCKQCGKGFHSLKALCGHMACHSEKDKGLKDDHSWSTSDNQKLLLDSHSDTEAEDRIIRTRSSKAKRLKKIVIKSPFCLANNNNGSSSGSEIDGEEQEEEVAMCLMLLSRDCGNKGGGANSVVETSDNNSIILETKSSSIDMKFGKRDALKNVHDQEEIPHIKKTGEIKFKHSVFDAEVEDSDSGYFLDENAKAESDASVDGFRSKVGYSEYDSPMNFNRNKISYRAQMMAKGNDDEYDDDGTRIESRKRRYISENSELYNDYGRMRSNNDEKRVKYECFNCKKTFKSYQALGGHRPCHKKSNASYESRYDSEENSLDDSTEFTITGDHVEYASNRKPSAKNISSEKKTKAKKNKAHACPFCSRVFKNGQALGGHKRSHFIGGHEVNNANTGPVAKPDLLDLNLPAPQEDEDDGNERISSWR